MDAFDLNPLHAASDSLACGAIAIDLNNPDLIYVGTGDGSGHGTGYTGVGPIISVDGGNNWNTESTDPASSQLSGSVFYAPLVGTPYNPSNPIQSNIVAFGSIRPWISTDFGLNWKSIPNNSRADDAFNSVIRSLVFASATKLYAGTWTGELYRLDNTSNGWTRTQIDTLGGTNNFPLRAIVTYIAIDPSDSTGNSIYLSLAGNGDYRHVWHFDGTEWQQRSGPNTIPSQKLLYIQASAIIVDPNNTDTVYVGMDIGYWRSTDNGMTWGVFSEELPDSAVMNLKIHPSGVLRASTHGRVYLNKIYYNLELLLLIILSGCPLLQFLQPKLILIGLYHQMMVEVR